MCPNCQKEPILKISFFDDQISPNLKPDPMEHIPVYQTPPKVVQRQRVVYEDRLSPYELQVMDSEVRYPAPKFLKDPVKEMMMKKIHSPGGYLSAEKTAVRTPARLQQSQIVYRTTGAKWVDNDDLQRQIQSETARKLMYRSPQYY